MIEVLVVLAGGFLFITAGICFMSGRPAAVLRSAFWSKWTIVNVLVGVLTGAWFLALHLWVGPLGYSRVVVAPLLPIWLGWILQLVVATRDVRQDERAAEHDTPGKHDVS